MYPKKLSKSPPGSIPQNDFVCIYPAKPKSAAAKAPVAPPKPKPEPTLEQKVADEVARRMNAEVGNFALGFLFGWLWEKHHRD